MPLPKPIELMKVEFATIETEQGTRFVFTPDQYERLTLNIAEMLRWIKEAMWRLQYYGAP